jgi:UDP-3-O-[3-hydroxymyristoyl] glucosamine N-acyltransferase
MKPGFGERMKTRATLEELATLVGGQVEGDGSLSIRGIAGLEEAGEGEITFLAQIKHRGRLEKSRASAAIVPTNLPSFPKPLIRTPNPYLAYAKIQAFFREKPFSPRGVDSRAFIGKGVENRPGRLRLSFCLRGGGE